VRGPAEMNTPAESSLSLELSRRFDAPPVRVFDAWLRKKVGRLPPRAKTCNVTRIEPRVGGWSGAAGSFDKLDAALARDRRITARSLSDESFGFTPGN